MTSPPPERDHHPRIPYAPGLDGVRGLAVLAVVVFHAAPADWLPGGFIGVSIFFTLSGFLIGSLVIAEVEARGGLDLGRFWARRARRLLPALLVTAVGVVVIARSMEVSSATRSDLIGGLTYSTNWVQLAAGRSYADLFAAPSPVTHLWSLAIEEQFYVVFPVLAWLAVRAGPDRIRRVLGVGAAVVAGAGAAFAWLVHDADTAYLATPARAAEIAVGLVLAAAYRPAGVRAGGRAAWVGPTVAGVLALALTGWVARTTAVTDAWIGRGGLAAFSFVSAALVVAAVRPGPVARLLTVPPLRGLGLISYGLYLYHWPVVVVLSHPRVDWAPVPLFAARLAVALAVSVLSYVLVEQPIRTGRVAALRPVGTALRVGAVALVAAVALVWLTVPETSVGPEVAARRPAPALVDPDDHSGATSSTSPETPGPPLVVVLGDSVPNWLVRDGAHGLDPTEVALLDGTTEGCDGAEGAPVGRAGTGVVVSVPASCTGWRSQYPPILDGHSIDIAVVVIGTGAVLDRRLDDGDFHGPCDPVARDWYRSDVAERLAFLHERADHVVLVLPAWAEDWSGWVNPSDHRARTDCVRTTLRAAAAEATAAGSPATAVVDMADELCPDGPDSCRPWRERDGVHVDPAHAPDVLRWLVDAAKQA